MNCAPGAPPWTIDEQGRTCWVVERAVFPPVSISQAVHAHNVDAGLAVLGLEPLPLPSGVVVRDRHRGRAHPEPR